MTDPAAHAVAGPAAARVLAVQDDGSLVAGPVALLLVVALGVAVFLLTRSMTGRLRRMRDNVDTGRWQGETDPGDPTGRLDDPSDPGGAGRRQGG